MARSLNATSPLSCAAMASACTARAAERSPRAKRLMKCATAGPIDPSLIMRLPSSSGRFLRAGLARATRIGLRRAALRCCIGRRRRGLEVDAGRLVRDGRGRDAPVGEGDGDVASTNVVDGRTGRGVAGGDLVERTRMAACDEPLDTWLLE